MQNREGNAEKKLYKYLCVGLAGLIQEEGQSTGVCAVHGTSRPRDRCLHTLALFLTTDSVDGE